MGHWDNVDTSTPPGAGEFKLTHWSLILKLSDKESSEAQNALTTLCQTYWYPVYLFIRRQGHDRDQAKDLTQEFFYRFLEKKYFHQANPEKGRFRSFLLASVQNFLSNEREKRKTVKRGGNVTFIPLDEILAEKRYRDEPVDNLTPLKAFERQWALALLERTSQSLRQAFVSAGKTTQFETLHVFISNAKEDSERYAGVAARLNMTPGAVRQAVHRLRVRFGELLREEVAQTVASPAEVDEELAYLQTVLGG